MTPNRTAPEDRTWTEHVLRAGKHRPTLTDEPDPDEHREHVEPWLSALFQSEHLNLLVGSGLATALAEASGAPTVDMDPVPFEHEQAEEVKQAARTSARKLGRGEANIEDQIRAVRELIGGLRILAAGVDPDGGDGTLPGRAARLLPAWESALDATLGSFTRKVLETEHGIHRALTAGGGTHAPAVFEACLAAFSCRSPAVRPAASGFTSSRPITTGSSSTAAIFWAYA